MISIDAYTNFLKNIFERSLANDISVSIHDEFYYSDYAKVNVTVKVLPGQIQCGIPQYPIELIIEVNEQYTKEVKSFLNSFAVDFNETLISIGDRVFKQFYSSPNVIGTFQDKGITKNTAISVSASLILYDNLLDLSIAMITSIDNNIRQQLHFVRFSVNYLIEANSAGSVNDPFSRSVGESAATTFRFVVIPTQNDMYEEILEQIIDSPKPNKPYRLSLSFDTNKGSKQYDINTILYSATITGESRGLPIWELVFMRGANNG